MQGFLGLANYFKGFSKVKMLRKAALMLHQNPMWD
jgi:hypothetical protein